jgi:DNA/RNA endonuclease YhcR with UshA esterase domain
VLGPLVIDRTPFTFAGGIHMKLIARGVAALSLTFTLAACAGTLRNPDIADVKQNAGHYSDRTVTVDGTVTSSWGVPLVPFRMYKVDDGTGEITVLARSGNRTPSKGSRVKVKGVVRDVAMFNGTPLGLHLEERDLDIRRN